MSTLEIFSYFDKIVGVTIEDLGVVVFKLIGDDMMFWGRCYNMLSEDRDYVFYVSGVFEGEIVSIGVSEYNFIELMELLEKINNWDNNQFGVELDKNKNRRLHKIFDSMTIKK